MRFRGFLDALALQTLRPNTQIGDYADAFISGTEAGCYLKEIATAAY